jgi:dTDP-4-amino-4,6-dideoxygalactose transaminase
LQQLKQQDIHAVFHYLSLHSSAFYTQKHDGRSLHHSDRYSEGLLRLPMYNNMDVQQQHQITASLKK